MQSRKVAIRIKKDRTLPGTHQTEGENKKGRRQNLILICLGLALVASGFCLLLYDYFSTQKFGVIDESVLVTVPVGEIPEGALYITYDRRQYRRGAMTLIIPAIKVYTPVGESTEPEGLEEMAGLYEFAQMPGEGDVNVSIAGHRDIYDKVFYSLDKVTDGDYFYLIYGDLVYRYIYKDTKVVGSRDWDVIKPQGFSCLTLTTCDPIGTSLNRLIVRAELVDFEQYKPDYQFAPDNL